MYESYAKILGNHAAEVIRRTSNLHPTEVKVSPRPQELPSCELAVRINFEGVFSGGSRGGGYVLCASARKEDSRPLLSALASHLDLSPDLIAEDRGPFNLLSEFLNIIIGLTGADWSEHGFDMNFSPPDDLSGQTLPPPGEADQAFHIVVKLENRLRLDLLAVFSGKL
ncbi:MAG: hypothetical protein LBP33_12920 [Candidatus Adiutrix sp.]|jgi:hypothetical protein|nr:hypothetical protein [Candidatus Adiutrix sp.]